MTDGIRTLVSGAVSDAIFSADGNTIYAAQGGTITAYSTATGAQIRSWTIGVQLGGMDLTPDGRYLVVAERTAGAMHENDPANRDDDTQDATLYRVDLTNGTTQTYTLALPGGLYANPDGFFDVAALTSGHVLASTNSRGGIDVDLATSNWSTTTIGPKATLSFSDDRSHIVTGSSPAQIFAPDGTQLASLSVNNPSAVQAISSSGALIAEYSWIYDSTGQLLVNLATQYPQWTYSGKVAGLAFSRDDSSLYVLGDGTGVITVLSTSDWHIERQIRPGVLSHLYDTNAGYGGYGLHGYGNSIQVSPDGRYVEVIGDDKLQLIDLQTLPPETGTKYGTGGNDTMVATADFPTINGLAGNDTLSDGGVSGATLIGGANGDTYHVSLAGTVIVEDDADTGFSRDIEYTSVPGTTISPGVETLLFEPGTAGTLFGDARSNVLWGGDGNDILVGGAGNDTLYGGGGNDVAVINVPRSSATISVDRISGSITISSSEGIQSLFSVETIRFTDQDVATAPFGIIGTSVDDTLTGSAADDLIMGLDGNDVLYGLAGSDTLDGGLGNDILDGGDGYDTAIIGATRTNSRTQVRVTDQGELQVTWYGGGIYYGTNYPTLNTATLRNIEAVRFVDQVFMTSDQTVAVGDLAKIGTSGSDMLTASAAGQALGGLDGNDILDAGAFSRINLNGGGGDDILIAGPGGQMTGGSGSDTFRGTAANLANYWVTDFAAGDKIHVTDASLANFSASMRISWSPSLTYTGGRMEVSATLRGIVLSADPNGGVDIMSIARAVQNDFDGDGRSDILWRSSAGQLSDWLGRADGGFTGNDANAFTNVPTNWHVVATGDFNGDQRSDILWRSDSGQLSDWLGQANGGFVGNDGNAFTNVPANWHVVGTGDLNGDGRSDILWRSDSGQLSDWLGQANGGFVGNDGNAFTTVATNWHVAGTGDFNGDGRSDILWRSDSGQLSDWLGQANGGFVGNDGNAFTTVATNWHIAGTGDFNGDGRSDILWRSDSGQLSDWLGKANGGFVANDSYALVNVPTAWHFVETGDFDGDGIDDILWRNDDGQMSNWLGWYTGGFSGNDANALTNVPTNWVTQPIHDLIV